eukprot:SAG25_NODE_84_length_16553_cov_5.346238_28_plen_117_part_00
MDITELQGQQPASEESQELSRRISDLGRRFGSQIWVAELRFGSQSWVADLDRSLRTFAGRAPVPATGSLAVARLEPACRRERDAPQGASFLLIARQCRQQAAFPSRDQSQVATSLA